MYSTEGIILKRSDTGEADALFTIYTKDSGKILARAQGIKKENAKLKGHLEPLSLSSVSLVSGKNGPRLVGASLINFFPEIRGDLNKLRAASYMVARVDRYCFDGEKDENLWGLILGAFSLLEKEAFKEKEIKDFLRAFDEKLMSALGYHGAKDPGMI